MKTPKGYNYREGGFWYECSIASAGVGANDTLEVTRYDGKVMTWPNNRVSKLGVKSKIGDDVLVYINTTVHAFKGKHVSTSGSLIEVKLYKEGVELWVDASKVHKIVTLDTIPMARWGKNYCFLHL